MRHPRWCSYPRLPSLSALRGRRVGKGAPKPTSLRPSAPCSWPRLRPPPTLHQGQETFIADALILLNHKIRNIEKKKLKLEDYRKRLKDRKTLNRDQMEAVEKYEKVIQNLGFARELQKTLGALSEDLFKAQKKVLRQEQVFRTEVEMRHLSTVLHIRHILQSLQQERVREELCSGHAPFQPAHEQSHTSFLSAYEQSHTPFLSTWELEHLLNLSILLGLQRDQSVSLGAQMERASLTYRALLEGVDTPVAGTTYRHMKELLARLMHCGYFEHIPAPRRKKVQEDAVSMETRATEDPPADPSQLGTVNNAPPGEFLYRYCLLETDIRGQDQQGSTQALPQAWRESLMDLEQQKPRGLWEMEFMGKPLSSQPDTQGGAVFPPKEQVTVKPRPAPEHKQALEAGAPVEGWSLPSSLPPHHTLALPSDSAPSLPQGPDSTQPQGPTPTLREQHLLHLLEQSQSAFTFVQASVLGAEHFQRTPPPGSAPPTEQREPKMSQRQENTLPQDVHPAPTPARLLPLDGETSLPHGGESLDPRTESAASENIQPSESEGSVTPPPRDSAPSVYLEENTQDQERFKVDTHLPPPRSDSGLKCNVGEFTHNLNVSTASTQTLPTAGHLDQEHQQPVTSYQSECPVGSEYQVYLCPGQPFGVFCRSNPAYYTRVRGGTRGGRGQAYSARSPGRHKGGFEGYKAGLRSLGGCWAPCPIREAPPVPYGAWQTACQHGYRLGGGIGGIGGLRTGSAAAWNDSAQLSSPEREGNNFASVESGRGTADPALTPLHMYPLPPPLRVAFSAARTANFAPGGLDQTIAFDMLLSNLGEAFEAHLGRFTCPAGGTYVFVFHMLKVAVSAPLYVNLMCGEEVVVSAYANDGAPDHETASNHAVLQLCRGERVWLRLHRGAIYGSNWRYSTFSGYLLYQD
ncbi:hypothetical protein AAFF_G00261790 [Aldrovandia affinis]|uniref:C1q domain-containing protein n=1 Tax=Aldrovandia affinis TaxID=143900 RepID=A0AAD7W2H9_9TELE|nr:hypothetical protein AAFF_G00261790 [Aldrovandia affinis]